MTKIWFFCGEFNWSILSFMTLWVHFAIRGAGNRSERFGTAKATPLQRTMTTCLTIYLSLHQITALLVLTWKSLFLGWKVSTYWLPNETAFLFFVLGFWTRQRKTIIDLKVFTFNKPLRWFASVITSSPHFFDNMSFDEPAYNCWHIFYLKIIRFWNFDSIRYSMKIAHIILSGSDS